MILVLFYRVVILLRRGQLLCLRLRNAIAERRLARLTADGEELRRQIIDSGNARLLMDKEAA